MRRVFCCLFVVAVLLLKVVTAKSFTLGRGDGNFYHFDTTSVVVKTVTATGQVASTCTIPFTPTSAVVGEGANIVVVTGIRNNVNTLAVVDMLTGSSLRSITISTGSIVSAVSSENIFLSQDNCFTALSCATLSVIGSPACTASSNSLIGSSNGKLVLASGSSISIVDPINFGSVSTIRSCLLCPSLVGSPIFADSNYIYTSQSGSINRYTYNSGVVTAFSSIRIGLNGALSVVRDACNTNLLTIASQTAQGALQMAQIDLDRFNVINAAAQVNILGLLNLGLNINLGLLAQTTSRINVIASGNQILFQSPSKSCHVCSCGTTTCTDSTPNPTPAPTVTIPAICIPYLPEPMVDAPEQIIRTEPPLSRTIKRSVLSQSLSFDMRVCTNVNLTNNLNIAVSA
ncbi:Rictor [Acrasis kona]|uniref:Rictor n=1 Tax=Acrasis kona TaxID=1008807 RepID=A0AAW2ZM59_9EUKA